jgi:glutaminase
VIAGDPAEALDLYTRQCSLDVNAKDLAAMSATLADGGVNPLTKECVVSPESGKRALAVIATAGLYSSASGRFCGVDDGGVAELRRGDALRHGLSV